MLAAITRSKLLLVEGKDEIEFFEALLDRRSTVNTTCHEVE